MDIDYRIAYAACRAYCAATLLPTLRAMEEEVWPRMRGCIYVPLPVFRAAARDALQEFDLPEQSEVLDNEECLSLLSEDRFSSCP